MFRARGVNHGWGTCFGPGTCLRNKERRGGFEWAARVSSRHVIQLEACTLVSVVLPNIPTRRNPSSPQGKAVRGANKQFGRAGG
jgi:hypothetical protein